MSGSVPRGGYALVISFPGGTVRFGRLSRWLPPGAYVYSGSALNGICGRVSRHRRESLGRGGGSKTRGHWHIDALLASCCSVTAICAPSAGSTECRLVRLLESRGMDPVDGFGSTDCLSGCRGHLLRAGINRAQAVEAVLGAFRDMGLDPSVCCAWSRVARPQVW